MALPKVFVITGFTGLRSEPFSKSVITASDAGLAYRLHIEIMRRYPDSRASWRVQDARAG
ncbi:hypothetical protein SBRY_50306 [Actinacidiphila bryophytorum]|uniref:Uncharacterized protein n=1 Tax=Actinacidiphila bryophytorum TaxID=1436133 RepID=A0A9W4MI91_9ACTN|nr:hypothetical protein SBRY_50306 [Actinacidiphila bryophytorum]